MSLQQALAKKAEIAYNQKEWAKACNSFDLYFKKTYPDQSKPFSIEDGVKLYQYANSLYNKIFAEKKTDYDQDDIDTIVEYVLSAQKTYNESSEKEKFPIPTYFDTFVLLGNIALEMKNYKQAETNFTSAYDVAIKNNCSWRDRLSSQFLRSIALEYQEKPKDAIELIENGLAIIEEELAKNPEEEIQKELLGFKNDLESKKSELEEDLTEQKQNPDILKNDDDANQEEEEEEEGHEDEEKEPNEENQKQE